MSAHHLTRDFLGYCTMSGIYKYLYSVSISVFVSVRNRQLAANAYLPSSAQVIVLIIRQSFQQHAILFNGLAKVRHDLGRTTFAGIG